MDYIRELRFANSERYKVNVKGTQLNMFFNQKFIFIHIPKTAGMSFKKAIYGDDIINEGHRKITFYKQVFRNKLTDYFIFSFVRNPWDRLYSAFSFLQNGGMNEQDKIVYNNYLKGYEDFEDFVINGLDKNIIRKIVHFTPQSNFICNKNGKILVDFLGRFESIDIDVVKLSESLGKKIILPHLNNNNRKIDYKTKFTSRMIDRISSIYRDDISIFNYNFE